MRRGATFVEPRPRHQVARDGAGFGIRPAHEQPRWCWAEPGGGFGPTGISCGPSPRTATWPRRSRWWLGLVDATLGCVALPVQRRGRRLVRPPLDPVLECGEDRHVAIEDDVASDRVRSGSRRVPTWLGGRSPIPGFGGGHHPIGWSSKTRRPSAASTGWSRSTPSAMRMNQTPSGLPRA